MIAEQLKKAILQAAIQGKLTHRLPEDGDARDLLKEIRAEKVRLVKEGKLKKEKPLPEISEDEIPFQIPENWVWVRLGELSRLITDGTHKTPRYVDDGIPFLSIQNISEGFFDFTKLKYITETEHNLLTKRCKPEPGDILFCRIGTLGKPIMNTLDFDFSIFVSLALIKLIDNKLGAFLVKFLSSPIMDFWIEQNKVGGGTHTNKINLRDLYRVSIPLPPIAEQQRILDQLEKVLPAIDKLSLDEKKLDELEQAFPKKMKDAILQYAIQGKLTEQLPEDGDARDLLKEIRVEKARLVKEGKLKKENPLPEISEDDIPFDIPENWQWMRLDDCCDISTGNSIPKHVKDSKYSTKTDGLPYIATKDVSFDNTIDYKNGIYIPFDEPNFRIAPENSILLCVEGGSAGRKIGITNQEVCFGNKLCKFEPVTIHPKLVFYYLQSSAFQIQFVAQMTGIIGGVGVNRIKSLPIPIPPIDEQQRIVERLEQLLPLCEKLE